MATPSAVGAYRALMRARAKAFAGDARALDAAHREIRAQFERAYLAVSYTHLTLPTKA